MKTAYNEKSISYYIWLLCKYYRKTKSREDKNYFKLN